MKKERLKFLFQGILLLILGMLFMSNPVLQGVIFLTVIGVTFAVIGIVTVIDGIFMTKEMKYKILRIFEGLLISATGIVFFLRNPARGAFLVVSLVVIMLMILAVTNTIAIFKSDNNIKWVAIVLNILVVWFGILSLFDPQLAVAIFYWTVSFQLIFTGVNNVMMYFLIPDLENVEQKT